MITSQASLQTANGAEEKSAGEKKRRFPGLMLLSDVQEKDVEWAWRKMIPLREVTMIEGHAKVGKSWLCMAIMAELAQAGEKVLYISNEDDKETVTAPRMKRVFGMSPESQQRVALFSNSIYQRYDLQIGRNKAENTVLIDLLRETQPRLVCFNTFTGFLKRGTSVNDGAKMRPIMDALSIIARDLSLSFVLVRHFNKASEVSDVTHRGSGNVEISAGARSIIWVVEHPDYPEDEEQREFTRHRYVYNIGLNVGFESTPLAFQLKPNQFTWIPTRSISAREAVMPTLDVMSSEQKAESLEATNIIEQLFEEQSAWLVVDLARRVREVSNETVKPSLRTLQRIKARLGLESEPVRDERGRMKTRRWVKPTKKEPT